MLHSIRALVSSGADVAALSRAESGHQVSRTLLKETIVVLGQLVLWFAALRLPMIAYIGPVLISFGTEKAFVNRAAL